MFFLFQKLLTTASIYVLLYIVMSARKTKKRKSFENSSALSRLVVLLLLVSITGAVGFEVFTTLPSAKVLGANTLLARGDNPEASGDKGERHNDIENQLKEQNVNPNLGSSDIHRTDLLQSITPPVNHEVPEIHGKEQEQPKIKSPETEDTIEVNDLNGETENEDVKIASDGGGFEMRGKHLGAKSHFPLSIDSTTNSLIITTPAGIKTVTILPDKAIENILNEGILSKIGGGIASSSAGIAGSDENGTNGSESATTGNSSDNIELTSENGETVYKIKGSKEKRFLGLIPVSVNKTVTVSGDTGEIQSTQESFFNRFLDTLSF